MHRLRSTCNRIINTTHPFTAYGSRYLSTTSPLNTKWNDIVTKQKDKIAIIQSEYEITYDELNVRANSLCYMLQNEYNLRKGDVIAHSSFLRIDDMIISIAASKLGLIYVPIIPIQTNKIPDIALRANAKLIIIDPALYQYVEATNIDAIVLTDEFNPNQWIANQYINHSDIKQFDSNESINKNDDNIIFFTSGTTGFPKGCVYTHQAFYNFTQPMAAFKSNEELETYTTMVSYMLTPAGLLQRWSTLLNGQLIVYTDKDKTSDVSHWHYLCQEKYPEITDVFFFGRAMADVYLLNKSFTNLKHIMMGGDGIPFKTVAGAKTNLLPRDAKLINVYGMIELGFVTLLNPKTMQQYVDEYVNGTGERKVDLPVGTAATQNGVLGIKIDENDGEILVKKHSEHMMKEYLKAPDLTKALRTDDGEWIKMGDIGCIDDKGLVYFRGRKKDVIKSTIGRIISPVEIETVLLSHKDIHEAAVVGYPNVLKDDTLSGESPVGFVSLTSSHLLKDKNKIKRIKEELIELCQNVLSEESMVSDIYFMDVMPKTGANKMNKESLKARFYDKTWMAQAY